MTERKISIELSEDEVLVLSSGYTAIASTLRSTSRTKPSSERSGIWKQPWNRRIRCSSLVTTCNVCRPPGIASGTPMTDPFRRPLAIHVVSLLIAVATILLSVTSSASAAAAGETRVRASAVAVEVPVGPPEHIGAGQPLGTTTPNGYVTYMNGGGQAVNPLTGRTLQPSDPLWHIELP